MADHVKMQFCKLPATPKDFDLEKFEAGDFEQKILYNNNKRPNQKARLTYGQVTDPDILPNYARFVPEDCIFIDFDNPDEAEKMHDIIVKSGLKCLILKTVKGYHFLFRKPEFYVKEATSYTNWFGYKFDSKGPGAVQIIRVCGMLRKEVCSWDLSAPIEPKEINTSLLDVLPYWLWGKHKTEDLHKGGKPGDSHYEITDTPFTQLMKMGEGGRHDQIFEHCGFFALSNGFLKDEFKTIIQLIHDIYLVKLGSPMSDADLFGDLDERWEDYKTTLITSDWKYDDKLRIWVKTKKTKLDERKASDYLFKNLDFYGKDHNPDGTFISLFYKKIDGPYNYKTDITFVKKTLRDTFGEQNFTDRFFREVEVQLMQLCAENNKEIRRNDKYIIVNNKILSCISPDAYDFTWLGSRAPTDVVLPWTWYPEEWVKEHEEDLGSLISKFIMELSRDSSGRPQKQVEQWLYVIAGASMIPANQLQKIVVLSGGGQNGKSLYTSLIRLCLGDDMFNSSKIFDSSPHDGFWGGGLDKGILCVVDDLNRVYNKDAFSYIKGAITGTDTVVINEKFKPKKQLDVLPQIIACTNFEFELYDKSEGMRRRVKILPTEYHVPDDVRDPDLLYKLVLNTMDKEQVASYKMSEDSFNHSGMKLMNIYTGEKAVRDSLKYGSLAWFANKCRYDYMHWLFGDLKLSDSDSMKEKFDGVFSGGFDVELTEFLEWYVAEVKDNIWTKALYSTYVEWHEETTVDNILMNERTFARNLKKSIRNVNENKKNHCNILMKKAKNDRGMALNKLFITYDEDEEENKEENKEEKTEQ